jgi:UDPglucose 6-dehydrogenase
VKIGVIGNGVVGGATARSFIEHVEQVYIYDSVKEKSVHDLETLLSHSEVIFLCLPTPQVQGSLECDTSVLVSFFDSLLPSDRHKLFVIRSTVPIGFTSRMRKDFGLLNVVHSPEFLTARCAVTDAQIPARNIIGEPRNDRGFPNFAGEMLMRLYTARFPSVYTHLMSSDESEAVKLMQNSFFAVKVAFWNECQQLAKTLGLSWERILQAIIADGRISPSHTKVPGPDGQYGFGGACLPKDIANLITCINRAGLSSYVCEAALDRNELCDRKRGAK